jgi:hypothetical protein
LFERAGARGMLMIVGIDGDAPIAVAVGRDLEAPLLPLSSPRTT